MTNESGRKEAISRSREFRETESHWDGQRGSLPEKLIISPDA